MDNKLLKTELIPFYKGAPQYKGYYLAKIKLIDGLMKIYFNGDNFQPEEYKMMNVVIIANSIEYFAPMPNGI